MSRFLLVCCGCCHRPFVAHVALSRRFQVDTCATIVPWTLVGEAPVRSICWFDPHQLVTVVASHAAPVVCTIQDDSLVATRAPVVVFLRHVASGRFSDALALAAQHSLDADIVHKAAWQQFVQRSPTLPPTQLEHDLDVVLTAHATNLCDKSWTLDTIKQCVLDTPAACHSVWSFGLSLDAADVGLQQLLDRLETFLQLVAADNSNELHDAAFDLTRAMADLADCFDVASFQHYLDVSWLDIAIELATAGRIAALTVRERVSIVPAPLRVAPDVTPAVSRCAFDVALSIESMHEGLAKLQREFDELHLFVYEFELTPTWTIQEWQHQEASGASPQAKIEIVRQNDATSDKLRTLLHRGYITEGDLCAYIISMDKTLLTNLMWASTIVAASSPIASNAPSSRYFRDMPTLVTVVLACCFGFVLDGPDGDAKHEYVD
ncbi:hypothetical protein DYB32_003938 [Aphanomyces invadans]|uniref:Uncharacterized protein n=1 Tax=Aphanomyces invadans TaxID=157072 RepID=A0A418AZ24_9STRA|nr:hypothetical protein DYB32_003938 [Aphanomyces invadans]